MSAIRHSATEYALVGTYVELRRCIAVRVGTFSNLEVSTIISKIAYNLCL